MVKLLVNHCCLLIARNYLGFMAFPYIDAHWVWRFPSHVRITHQKPTLNPHVDLFFVNPSMFQWYSHDIPILIHFPMIFAMSPMNFSAWKTPFLFSPSGCLEELVPATLCGQASRGEAGDVNHGEISLGFMVDTVYRTSGLINQLSWWSKMSYIAICY